MNRRNGKIGDFLIINSGLLMVALGIYLFKAPNNFATGGVSGLAIVFGYFFPGLSTGPLMMAINIILIIIGFITIGKNFGNKTIYSSFALSGMVWVFQQVHPIQHPLTGDTFLELVFGIMLPGVGSAIVFNQNASTGGTDIVAKILTKYSRLHIGKTLFLADFLITIAAGFVFGVRIGLYSLLGLTFKTFLVDYAIEGFNTCKVLTIVSNKHDEIKDYIVNSMKRGATIHKAYGAYTDEEKEVITTVVSKRQAVKLRDFIRDVDPKAFITITSTSEIIGKGFRDVDL